MGSFFQRVREYFAPPLRERTMPTDMSIYSMLRERGMSQHVAEAFMDSFQSESGLDPEVEEIEPLVAGSRGGRGLYQLTGSRRRAYENWVVKTHHAPWDIESQIEFLFWELTHTERKAWAIIRRTTTRMSAVRAITKYFLRPAVDNSAHRIGAWKPSQTRAT